MVHNNEQIKEQSTASCALKLLTFSEATQLIFLNKNLRHCISLDLWKDNKYTGATLVKIVKGEQIAIENAKTDFELNAEGM